MWHRYVTAERHYHSARKPTTHMPLADFIHMAAAEDYIQDVTGAGYPGTSRLAPVREVREFVCLISTAPKGPLYKRPVRS